MYRSHGSEAILLLPPRSARQPFAPVPAGDFPGAERSLEAAVREAVTAVLLHYYPDDEAGLVSTSRFTSEEIERRLEERGGWDEV